MWSDVQETWKKRLLALNTSALSDAMDSLGICRALPGIVSRVRGAKIAGPAFTVQYGPVATARGEFRNAGNYIDHVEAHHVVVVDNEGRGDCTNWGGILTQMAVQKAIAGTVINGSARDIDDVRRLDYPLFSKNVFMVSGKNRVGVRAIGEPLDISGVTVAPGDWMVGDDNGVLVVAAGMLDEVISRAERVEAVEKRITQAIADGMRLKDAREEFGYARPWEGVRA